MQSYNLLVSFGIEVMAVLISICCIVYLIKQIAKFAIYLYKLDEQVAKELSNRTENKDNKNE